MLTHENIQPRIEAPTKKKGARDGKPGSRTLMSYIPVASAALGITVVISSVVFLYVEDDLRRLVVVTLGLAFLVAGIWFAANPFLRNARRFMPMREQVAEFIDHVRLLNHQVSEAEDSDEVERTEARMHEAVDRIVATAKSRSSEKVP